MLGSPFFDGLTLGISDGNADLPQHLLVDLADRRPQHSNGGRGIEIKNRHEVLMGCCSVREIEIVYNFIGAFDFEEAREQSQAAQKDKKTGVA